jgi:hypothetical protein
MANIEQMRDYLINHTKYAHSLNWKAKVERMPFNQVLAVYIRLINQPNSTVK